MKKLKIHRHSVVSGKQNIVNYLINNLKRLDCTHINDRNDVKSTLHFFVNTQSAYTYVFNVGVGYGGQSTCIHNAIDFCFEPVNYVVK